METNNLAVLIDFENIAAGTEKEGLGRFDVETLMQRVKDKGRILVARSYADWGRFSRFKQSLLTANVTMMELTSHGMQDKNRADIAMVVDALELALTRAYVDTFVVVSGDSDFTPLVLKLRELNKRVIGIGTRKSTSRLLIQACDEFMFYDTVVQQPKKKGRKVGVSEEMSAIFDLVAEAITGLQRDDPVPPLASVVKSAVLRKSPDFSESDLGFPSFARFLEAAQDAGIVKIIRDQKSGGYRVELAEDAERPHARPPAAPAAAAAAAADDDDDAPTGTGRWVDEYMPARAKKYVDALAEMGLPQISTSTRMAVLEALDGVVAERSKKRRKTTVQFVKEDVQKKLRRTHPDLPMTHLQGLLDGLMQANELIHRDGTAIRSGSAAFTLQKSPEGLNEALVRLYLGRLKETGLDLSDTGLLAELFYGDSDRRRLVEENLAYTATSHDEGDIDDLDALLVTGANDGAAAAPRAAARVAATVDLDSLDDLLLATGPAAEAAPADGADDDEKPSKRRRTRKKPEAGDEKPKARGRRAPKVEATSDSLPDEYTPSGDLSDLDSLLEPG